MKHNYSNGQSGKIGNLKFNHQIKCQGVCGGKTFTAKDGNTKYCPDCQKKLGKQKWDPNLKKPVPIQTTLIEEEKDKRERLMRLDHEI